MDNHARLRTLDAQIVATLEKNQDATALSRERARLKDEITQEAELAALSKVAETRQALRVKAADVEAKTARQGQAIDRFLKARDVLLPRLQELQDPMKELSDMARPSWEGPGGECYLYNDATQFSGAVRGIPREMLPADFSCPTLAMTATGETSYGKAAEAAAYLQCALGILQSFKKGSMPAPTSEADPELLLGIETTEPETAEPGSCRVCGDPRVETINACLRQGRPLRDIEAEVSISRSTLSRHRHKCLSLGAVEIAE